VHGSPLSMDWGRLIAVEHSSRPTAEEKGVALTLHWYDDCIDSTTVLVYVS
jgi:hypothetical protein